MARVEGNNVTVSQGVRMLFSLMTPNESSFATIQEVPKYVNQVSLTSLPRSWKIYENNYVITHILSTIRATQCLTRTHRERIKQSLRNRIHVMFTSFISKTSLFFCFSMCNSLLCVKSIVKCTSIVQECLRKKHSVHYTVKHTVLYVIYTVLNKYKTGNGKYGFPPCHLLNQGPEM